VNLLLNNIGVEQAQSLAIILKEHPTLKSLCGNNGDETELDMSGKMEGAEDAIMLVPEIAGNRAISTLIFGDAPDEDSDSNSEEGDTKEWEPAVLEVGMTQAAFSNKNLGVGGAIIISAWILHKDKGALLHLDVSSNNIGELVYVNQGWTRGLNTAQTALEYKHTDGRVQAEEPAKEAKGAIAVAIAIKHMGALTKFDISSNDIRAEGGLALAAGLKCNQVVTELNISDNNLGRNSDYLTDTSGIIAIADAIPDMGAILSVNLLKNDIGVEQARALVSILKEHPTLKSLCGNNGDETELDMSGKMLEGAEDAIMLATEIVNNGALLSLNLANNGLGVEVPIEYGWKTVYDGGWKWKHADGREQQEAPPSEPRCSIAIANSIPDMRAILQFTFSGDSYDSTPVTMETSMVEANFGGKGLGISGAIMVAAFLPKCT
jgi:hypothetical protein